MITSRWPRLPAAAFLVTGAVAANLLLGAGLGSGTSALVALVIAIPAMGVATWVMLAHRDWLIYGALLLIMLGGTLNDRLPGTGGTAIFPADIFVVLAIAGHLSEILLRGRGARRAKLTTIVLSWPLALLVIALVLGVFRGHERYGTSYFSQPMRIVIYAAIGVAVVKLEPRTAYRRIVAIFYLTTVVSVLQGVYNLATGTSQTTSSVLSTGGSRPLALTTAMFLAAALVLALLNIDLDPHGKARRLHLTMAGLSSFGVLIALGRTTFAAVGVLIPILLIGLRRMRRTMLAYAPIVLVFLALAVAVLSQLAPSLGSTVTKRFSGNVGTDAAVVQRQRKYDATMKGFGREPILGLGFGRPVQFVSIDLTVQTFSGDPENSYIYVLAGGGLFALLALMLVIVVYFGDVVRRLRRTTGEVRALVAFSASLAFILLVNALSGPILSDPSLMLVLWIALLLPALSTRGDRDELESQAAPTG